MQMILDECLDDDDDDDGGAHGQDVLFVHSCHAKNSIRAGHCVNISKSVPHIMRLVCVGEKKQKNKHRARAR